MKIKLQTGFCIVIALLMMLSLVSSVSAITVDGNKTSGEWNENWAFGQTNNATAASEYDINNLGDRLEIMQGTLQADTGDYNAVDPKNDSGSSYDESMALNGNSSGSDLYKVYGHYNQSTDTLYGMTEVYGIPGDHDGNGDVTTESSAGDSGGDVGPAGFGLSTQESWSIAFYQAKNGVYQDYSLIQISDNDWNIIDTDVGLDYNNVSSKFSYQNFRQIGDDTLPKSVYEVKVENFSKFYDVNPGSKLAIQVGAGSSGDPEVGEDSGVVFFEIPNPQIDIEKSTNGVDADNVIGPEIPIGDDVNWTYNVTNTGNTNLTNISVTDSEGVSVTCPTNTLAPGESMICTANGTAQEGQYSNIGNVTANFSDIIVTDEDPSHYFGVNASIDIEKSTNGDDADTPTGPEIGVGDPVTWNYTVTNTGNVNLSSVEVSDNQTAFTSSIGELAVGESTTVTNTSTAMEGQYANLGNVTGQYSNNITIDVTDEDPSHYFGVNASIDIEKSTNGDDADTPTGPEIGVGDPVTWNYTVTNTGNVNLSSVEVSDNQTAFTSSIGELAVGESTTVTNTSTAMEGQYANLGNVTGQYSNNITIDVTDEDPSHYFGVNASIDIEKSTNGDDADTPTGPEIGVR
ncbi:COG1470 family protein [Methanohalobium evestigatum]|uniref:COG1470 family protein n=1 Tax=Methanohalobium evestigatum TaxID=2322 RepID=UPI0006776584|nr:hypothetical protein [Methanohalobium evestigatum]